MKRKDWCVHCGANWPGTPANRTGEGMCPDWKLCKAKQMCDFCSGCRKEDGGICEEYTQSFRCSQRG